MGSGSNRRQQPRETYGWYQSALYCANEPNFNDVSYLLNADKYAWYAEYMYANLRILFEADVHDTAGWMQEKIRQSLWAAPVNDPRPASGLVKTVDWAV